MSERKPNFGLAVVLWMAGQLAALGIAGGRLMLSARYPHAGEQWALGVMLVIQVGLAAMLCPSLFCEWRATLLAVALAWPMGQLAAFESDASLHAWVLGEGYVSAWILILHIWMRAMRGPEGRMYVSAIASMLSFGGPVILYLRSDFLALSGDFAWRHAAMYGPIMGALSLIFPEHPINAWYFLWIWATFAIVFRQIANKSSMR